MNLPRIKELVAAGEKGALRKEEWEELWKLLPAVIAAAEVPAFAIVQAEAFAYFGEPPPAEPREPWITHRARICGYVMGALREGRVSSP